MTLCSRKEDRGYVRITNSFFNAKAPSVHFVYMMPAEGTTRLGYAFAEFEAARRAITQAFSQANWDGYGALPVREETKKNALSMLNHLETLTCAPEVTANPNGTLSFEWETNQGCGQLEIGRTRYSFCVQPHHGSPMLNSGDASEINPGVALLVDALLYPKPSRPVSTSAR
jgi:hypothetical protein